MLTRNIAIGNKITSLKFSFTYRVSRALQQIRFILLSVILKIRCNRKEKKYIKNKIQTLSEQICNDINNKHILRSLICKWFFCLLKVMSLDSHYIQKKLYVQSNEISSIVVVVVAVVVLSSGSKLVQLCYIRNYTIHFWR